MAYVTMNNFQIAGDQAAAFEGRWHSRTSRLHEVPGFESFFLLRGDESEGAVHYATCAVWASKEAFEAWTKSENFAQAHGGAPLPKGMVLGHPVLQRFDVLLQLASK